MKKILYAAGIIAVSLNACKKSDVKLTPLASINVTNAIVNSTSLVVSTMNTKIDYAANPNQIGFGSNAALSMLAGSAVPITVTDLSDSTKAVYKTTINAPSGSYYSLFLAGQAGAVDGILIKDSYTNYADSVAGIRFINLSSDSQPISVDIQGSAGGSEVSSLAYKANSGFKKYSNTSVTGTYTFEFRDVATGTALATYSFDPNSNPLQRFHNATLALIGLESTGVSVVKINNY